MVHPGPSCRVRPDSPADGAVVTVAMWRWDGYHRRVVTSVRLAARERGRFRLAAEERGRFRVAGAGSRPFVVKDL